MYNLGDGGIKSRNAYCINRRDKKGQSQCFQEDGNASTWSKGPLRTEGGSGSRPCSPLSAPSVWEWPRSSNRVSLPSPRDSPGFPTGHSPHPQLNQARSGRQPGEQRAQRKGRGVGVWGCEEILLIRRYSLGWELELTSPAFSPH